MKKKNRTNIILISIDTLRADHLSCYGYKRLTTPQIDRIAEEGILFKNAYSAAVWTPPAHASMLTGLYPSQHGTVDFKKLRDKIPTIAEVLCTHGYSTVGFVNNPAVGEFVGLEKGHKDFFEIWRGLTSKNIVVRGYHFLYRNWLELLGIKDHGAKKTNKLVKNWLKSNANKDRPFYMFLHYIEPHNPINAPYPFKMQFVDSKARKLMDMKKLQKVASNPLYCYTDNLKLTQAEIEHLISLYDGEIAYVDSMIGEILDTLKEMKILDDTMVIITADHGEHFGEHDHFSHVSSLYEPIVHIPLIIRYPHVYRSSQIFEHPVQHVDIFPTILEFLHIKDDSFNNLPGKSLLPKNGQIEIEKERQIFAEWEGRIPHFVKDRLSGTSYDENLFTKKLKMILEGHVKFICDEDGYEEFYNLRSDPDELNNLAATERDRCRNLRESIMQILKADASSEEHPQSEMDELIKQRLQGLGYL